mmetsp:Transcript_135542/g.191791  ORF Transcript_135542/g.191791 Transcript_135542/m.191791 type:complete len:246 (+) Transcript_135542:1004-1741(+)
MADVHGGGIEGSEERTDAGACAVDDHRLCHGVVVAGGGRTLDTAHGADKAHHAHQEERGDEAANLREAAQAHKDGAGEHVVLEGIGVPGTFGLCLGRACAGHLRRIEVLQSVAVLCRTKRSSLACAASRPPGDGCGQKRQDANGNGELPEDVVPDTSKEAVEDDEQRNQADHGLHGDVQHRNEGKVHEANSHHRRVESSNGSSFADALAHEGSKHFEDAKKKVGGHGNFPCVVCRIDGCLLNVSV